VKMESKAEAEDVWDFWEGICDELTTKFAEVPVSIESDREWYRLWYQRVEWMVDNFVGEFRALRGAVKAYPMQLDFKQYFEYKEIAYKYIRRQIKISPRKKLCRERFNSPECEGIAEEVLQKMQQDKPFISKENLDKVLESRDFESTSSPEINAIQNLLKNFELKGLNLMDYLKELIEEQADLKSLEEMMKVKYRF